MSAGTVHTERHGNVLLMGVDRVAKRNAFDIPMFRALSSAYGLLQHDPELRCGVVHALGPHFTAGLDLPEWAAGFSTGRFPELPADGLDPFGLDPERQVGKPVVMALQGICYTIGMELMLAADIRIAAADVRLAQIEVRRGIYPVGGGTVRLAGEIGWGNAMRYLLTGDEITAPEALRLGLVQQVVEPGRQLERAVELAEHIARQAPLGVIASLRSARIARIDGERTAIARLLPDLLPLMTSEDVQEGLMSFLERRPAEFKGR